MGNATIEQETELVAYAKAWIEDRREDCEAYQTYLDHFSDWANPWDNSQANGSGPDAEGELAAEGKLDKQGSVDDASS